VVWDGRFGNTYRSHLRGPRYSLSVILDPLRLDRQVVSKRRFQTPSRPVIIQKTEEFSTTSVLYFVNSYEDTSRLFLRVKPSPHTQNSEREIQHFTLHKARIVLNPYLRTVHIHLPTSRTLNVPRSMNVINSPTNLHICFALHYRKASPQRHCVTISVPITLCGTLPDMNMAHVLVPFLLKFQGAQFDAQEQAQTSSRQL
jgi:hypothetical protein